MTLLVVLTYRLLILAGCAYLVGWKGWSAWWFVLAVVSLVTYEKEAKHD